MLKVLNFFSLSSLN